jgi:hypothetical protein
MKCFCVVPTMDEKFYQKFCCAHKRWLNVTICTLRHSFNQFWALFLNNECDSFLEKIDLGLKFPSFGLFRWNNHVLTSAYKCHTFQCLKLIVTLLTKKKIWLTKITLLTLLISYDELWKIFVFLFRSERKISLFVVWKLIILRLISLKVDYITLKVNCGDSFDPKIWLNCVHP